MPPPCAWSVDLVGFWRRRRSFSSSSLSSSSGLRSSQSGKHLVWVGVWARRRRRRRREEGVSGKTTNEEYLFEQIPLVSFLDTRLWLGLRQKEGALLSKDERTRKGDFQLRERESRTSPSVRLPNSYALGASMNDVRYIFGFLTSPPCPHL